MLVVLSYKQEGFTPFNTESCREELPGKTNITVEITTKSNIDDHGVDKPQALLPARCCLNSGNRRDA